MSTDTPAPEPIAVIDGVPQYAQGTWENGAIIVAGRPPAVAPETAAEAEAGA